MKAKNFLALAAVLIFSLGALAQQEAQQQQPAEGAAAEALKKFTNFMQINGMNLSFVHLNKVTVNVLFPGPQNQAWKTRSRLNTLFFVQAVATKDVNFEPNFVAEQNGNRYTAKILTKINNSKFELGHLTQGEKVAGIISFDKALDINQPFKVFLNMDSVDFKFDKKALDLLKDSPASQQNQ